MRVLLVFGTRPEAVKMAPLIRAMREDEVFNPRVCVTGQHREMLNQILGIFEIEPHHDLAVMQSGQDLFDVTARVLLGLRKVIQDERPDLVLVQGDTTTALAGALAGFYLKVPVTHIEAGHRTFCLDAPFPEEGNRALVSRISQYHFAPTSKCRENLLTEGIDPSRIWVTGNTVIDALFWMRDRVKGGVRWEKEFGSAAPVIFAGKPFILVTVHRRENFGKGLEGICLGLSILARRHPDWHIVCPVHLNPNIREPLRSLLGNFSNIHLIAPLEYPAFVFLMSKAKLILTDSGGIQEEAPALGKPVLVMRANTERPEGIEEGTVRLVGIDPEKIVMETEMLMSDDLRYREMSRVHLAYGDGQASARILAILKDQGPRLRCIKDV